MSLNQFLRWVLNAFELGAACTGVYYWNKWKGTYWKWFTVFLFFIFITEIIGKFSSVFGYVFNAGLYRYINMPVYFIFQLWLLGKLFESNKKLSASWLFIIAYTLLFLAEEFLLSKAFNKTWGLSSQVASLGILVLSMQYFIKLLKSDGILLFKNDIQFWVSTGLMGYVIIMLPFRTLYAVIDVNVHQNLILTYWNITFVFNYIMYTFFALGFIWGKPKSS